MYYTFNSVPFVVDHSGWLIVFWIAAFFGFFAWIAALSDRWTSTETQCFLTAVWVAICVTAYQFIPDAEKVVCLNEKIVAEYFDSTAELRSNGKTSTNVFYVHYKTPDGTILTTQPDRDYQFSLKVYAYKQNDKRCR